MTSDTSYVGVRYERDRAKGGHVESYFLKANSPDGRRAVWLKATIYAGRRGAALAESWAIAFDRETGHVAVKSSVPIERAHFGKNALDVEVDGARFAPGRSGGKVASGGRAIGWELAYESHAVPLVHFPRAWMYEGPLPSSKLVSPLPDLRVSGSVDVTRDDGTTERWELDRWPGLLGHNWGKKHAHRYAWGHCNVWDDPKEELVFEGVTARVKMGPVVTPSMTLLCVRWRGVRYDLNGLPEIVRNDASVSTRRWTFRGKGPLCTIEGELSAATDDFVGLHYDNPDGTVCHCLNSKIADARLELTVRGRAPRTFRSRAAALEIGTTDPAHGVRMYV